MPNTLQQMRKRCGQVAKIWGKVGAQSPDQCVRNCGLHTSSTANNAYAVSKSVKEAVFSPRLTHSFSGRLWPEITLVATDLSPFSTPPITTTTMYINILLGRSF